MILIIFTMKIIDNLLVNYGLAVCEETEFRGCLKMLKKDISNVLENIITDNSVLKNFSSEFKSKIQSESGFEYTIYEEDNFLVILVHDSPSHKCFFKISILNLERIIKLKKIAQQ